MCAIGAARGWAGVGSITKAGFSNIRHGEPAVAFGARHALCLCRADAASSAQPAGWLGCWSVCFICAGGGAPAHLCLSLSILALSCLYLCSCFVECHTAILLLARRVLPGRRGRVTAVEAGWREALAVCAPAECLKPLPECCSACAVHTSRLHDALTAGTVA